VGEIAEEHMTRWSHAGLRQKRTLEVVDQGIDVDTVFDVGRTSAVAVLGFWNGGAIVEIFFARISTVYFTSYIIVLHIHNNSYIIIVLHNN
jgi:hypothetical protein